MKSLHTDPAFLAQLREAARRGVTPAELHAQKVGWIAAELDISRGDVERQLGSMTPARKADRLPPLAPQDRRWAATRNDSLPSGWWILPGVACGLAFWAVIFIVLGWL